MKRLSILLIACVAVFGNISAQNELSAKEAAKLEQDSIIANLTSTLHGTVKNLGAQGAPEYLVSDADKAIDRLATLRYQEPDDETSSAADETPQVTPADSIAMLNDSIKFMNEKLALVKKNNIPQYEDLYLMIVNDFLKGETYMGGLPEVKAYLEQVRYNENKEDFKVLLDNYNVWLKDIASICLNAQEDLKANKRAWKNPNDSRAEIFVRRLEDCSYYHRADKEWSVPYIEGIIQRAISRIRAYKTTQSVPMTFDDIIPTEFLPEKPKVETQNVQQTESTPTENMMGKINATIPKSQTTKPNTSSAGQTDGTKPEGQPAEANSESKPGGFKEDAIKTANDLLKKDKTKGTEAENSAENVKTNVSEEQQAQ